MNKILKIRSLVYILVSIIVSSCFSDDGNENLLGNDFRLFKNTELEELAKYVADQNASEIRRILSSGSVDVNYQEKKYGNTLLMLAVTNSLNISVLELLKGGADPNLRDFETRENALDNACFYYNYQCNVDVVDMLIKHGADVNAFQRYDNPGGKPIINSPLTIASSAGCYETVKLLVQSGAKIDTFTYHDGYGAITEAIIQDEIRIAKYLIVDCKSPVPETCYIRENEKGEEVKLSVTDMLNENDYKVGDKNYKYKKEILRYLENKGIK